MEAPFWTHVDHLRSAIIQTLSLLLVSFCIVFSSHTILLDTLRQAYTEVTSSLSPGAAPQLILLSPFEGIALVMHICIWGSLLLSAPLLLVVWARFIFPGLRNHEKEILRAISLTGLFFVFLGLIAFLNILLPMSVGALYKINKHFGVNAWSAAAYYQFTTSLLFGTCIIFLIIGALFQLTFNNILSSYLIRSIRKYFWLSSFIMSALVTPPDIFSQVALALPLIGVFELCALYQRVRSRKNSLPQPQNINIIEKIPHEPNNTKRP